MAEDQSTPSSPELSGLHNRFGDNSASITRTSPTTPPHTPTSHTPSLGNTSQAEQHAESVGDTNSCSARAVSVEDTGHDSTGFNMKLLLQTRGSPPPYLAFPPLRIESDNEDEEDMRRKNIPAVSEGASDVSKRFLTGAVSCRDFSTPEVISNVAAEFRQAGDATTGSVRPQPCAECRGGAPPEPHQQYTPSPTQHRHDTHLPSPLRTPRTPTSYAEDLQPDMRASQEKCAVVPGDALQPSLYRSNSDGILFACPRQVCDTPPPDVTLLTKPSSLHMTGYDPVTQSSHSTPYRIVSGPGVRFQEDPTVSPSPPYESRGTNNSDTEKDATSSFPLKRVRKKAYLTFYGAEKFLPEILEDPAVLRCLGDGSLSEGQHRRESFVKVAVGVTPDMAGDSLGRGYHRGNPGVSTEDLGDQTQAPNTVLKDAQSNGYHVQSDSCDAVAMTVVNIRNDGGRGDGLVNVERGFTRDDKQGDKSSKVKSVFFYVEEDEICKYQNKNIANEQKDSVNNSGGQENLAYVSDEQDTVSRDENVTPSSEEQQLSPEPIRSSGTECLTVVKNDILRSASYDTDLSQVLNNLSGDQTSAIATPTLRKRSTSRGRPDYTPSDSEGTEKQEETSFSSKESKKEIKPPPLRPNFSLGSEDSSPSIFRKLINNPFMKLTRSESVKSSKSYTASPLSRAADLSKSNSTIWDTRSRGSGHHGRPPQAPSSVCRDDQRHYDKSYIIHNHLYRNSRRNVQQKLHRQLSEPRHEECRYNDCHRDEYYHKKHDSYLDHRQSHSRHSHSDHHGSSRHAHSKHSHHEHSDHHSVSGLSKHSHRSHHSHDPLSPTRQGFSESKGPHHHRSHSQRNTPRPKQHTLRRLNTYANEDYHKYLQQHEHIYEHDQPFEHEQVHGSEYLPNPEEAVVRKVSHYRQEEKGTTDVERWVGVHGGQASEAPGSSNVPASPNTPHIVVSTENETSTAAKTPADKPPTDIPTVNTSGSNGQVLNGQSLPSPPPTPANNTEEKKQRPDKLSLNMIAMDLPECRHTSLDFNMYRKSRRNSMNEMFKRIGGSQTNLQQTLGANTIRRSSSRNSLMPSVLDWKQEGNDSLIACLSALYGKLLVVMGMAFPIAEVISHDIPISFYNGFYLYLYIGSIIFLVYAYVFLLRSLNLPTEHLKSKFQSLRSYMAMPDLNTVFPRRNTAQQEGPARMSSRDSRLSGCSEIDKESDRASINTMSFKPPKFAITGSNNHGSMYLKMGAVLFGIGSMIYSGLEVGQYFELKADDDCANILLVVSPAARMLFTFIQMYFIFLNSRVAISRHRVIARFGLMHMIGTNLCIWLNVLVQETKHEIINLTLGHGRHDGGHSRTKGHHEESTASHTSDLEAILGSHGNKPHDIVADHSVHPVMNESHHLPHTPQLHDLHLNSSDGHHHIVRRSGEQAFSIYECRRSQLMGQLVDNASPFLFPCTIEYSLLCAGVLYVIWKNINKPEVAYDGDSDISTYVARKARHHYSVDCAHANRGLFMGILVLVLTIISLILFFVLINNDDYKSLAILEANIIELSVYGVATVTVVIGMVQMRELEFVPEGDIELDNILLLIAQTGVYIYTSFTVIGGHYTLTDHMILPLLSAIITLIQATLQTIFILDATRRCCYNHEQLQRKPGREMVTFLLVCNLAMWAINTFETSRADAHPTQLNFYGIWAWTIISHVSMPLAIFYRFHVTVCLCEIWKRSYKLKSDF
nr:uncharacterized protein LOC123762940 isoform X2 [Procambarus clarkii]